MRMFHDFFLARPLMLSPNQSRKFPRSSNSARNGGPPSYGESSSPRYSPNYAATNTQPRHQLTKQDRVRGSAESLVEKVRPSTSNQWTFAFRDIQHKNVITVIIKRVVIYFVPGQRNFYHFPYLDIASVVIRHRFYGF